MDTIQTYMQEKFDQTIDDFIVAGASKRGWTTWLTAAVDSRCKAIIPLVMGPFYMIELLSSSFNPFVDALNFIPNVHHFWQAYGGWTFALSPYYNLNFTRELDLVQTAEVT